MARITGHKRNGVTVDNPDKPITDKELDDFWGVPVTHYQVATANREAAQSYDKDDLIDACCTYENEILTALGDGNLQSLYDIFHAHQIKTIKERADRMLYGRVIDLDAARKAGL
jgi:hypothetical protein